MTQKITQEMSYPCEQVLQNLRSQKVGYITFYFDHSLNKYVLSTYYVLSTVLDMGDKGCIIQPQVILNPCSHDV